MITLNQHGKRVNKAHVDRSELRDAETELEAICKDYEALISRIKAAADDHGCVCEHLTDAAERLALEKIDTVDAPLAWVKDKLFWWEHNQ